MINILNIVFNDEERKIISKAEIIENRDYAKEDINRIENKILDEIMSNSKNKISNIRQEYSRILDKLESYNK